MVVMGPAVVEVEVIDVWVAIVDSREVSKMKSAE